MSCISSILKEVKLPKIIKVKQIFEADKIDNISQHLINELIRKNMDIKISKNMKIAITAGSRGISSYPLIMKTIVDFVKSHGGIPFIVPAMGSHGGGNSEGQVKILKNLGITEETMECEIISSMEVVEIGKTIKHLPVYIDKNAYNADGIILLNRIKPHTSFRGNYESGLIKMLAIGLGKRKGAEMTHFLGFESMGENILESAKISIDKLNILFGVCTIENAYDEVYHIFVLNKEELLMEEPKLLIKAKELMPRIYLDNIDVLIVKEIGKTISGTGMDTNIIGRYHTKAASGGPSIIKLGILNINKSSCGNANGMGLADYIPKKFYNEIDFEATYLNALTSTEPNSVKLPMVVENDEDVFKACAKTCGKLDANKIKLVIIDNTKKLNEVYISTEAYLHMNNKENIKVISSEVKINFDKNGNLLL
ncbi:MAG: lactate racemase domain-containing protein [Terrisporobacter sp.]|uniref:DUF362 domain-containing protein n=1 Tax=Terrisporobacter sp. TaxID=1965305 RepID=UPI002FC97B5C